MNSLCNLREDSKASASNASLFFKSRPAVFVLSFRVLLFFLDATSCSATTVATESKKGRTKRRKIRCTVVLGLVAMVLLIAKQMPQLLRSYVAEFLLLCTFASAFYVQKMNAIKHCCNFKVHVLNRESVGNVYEHAVTQTEQSVVV